MSEDAFTPAPRPCWIGGRAEQGPESIAVSHPYDGTEVAEVAVPDATQVARAMDEALRYAAPAPRRRAAMLERLATVVSGRAEEIVETVTAEAGKPWRLAEQEVARAVAAIRAAAAGARELAEPSRRIEAGGTPGAVCLSRRLPGAPVALTVPAAEPFGVAAAGVAAAAAAGVGVLVLPSVSTPLSASLLGETLAEAELTGFSVLPGHPVPADARFTGTGPGAGFCAAVLRADWAAGSDVAVAAALLARHAMSGAGQSPLAVRQVLVPAELAEPLCAALVDAVAALGLGSPHDPAVDVGPLPDAAAAERVAGWVSEAIANGARLLCGGTRDGASVAPTVLAADAVPDVPGPVLVVSTVDSDAAAVAAARGDSAAVFTHDGAAALELAAHLGVPVAVGDLPAAHPDLPEFAALSASGPGAVPALITARTTAQPTVFPALRP